MKKTAMAIAAGVMLLALSSCGQTKDLEEKDFEKVPADGTDGANDRKPEESGKGEEPPVTGKGEEPQVTGKEEEPPVTSKEEEPPVTGETGTVLYEGKYLDYDTNEPLLEIRKNGDGTYQIQITIYRLFSFDDGTGRTTEEGLEFTATGPDGNAVNGVIKLEGDIAAVSFLGQEWIDFAGISEYKFYRASNHDSKKEDELENLIGEYNYVSDDGTGKLIIEKTSCGYDISDYESESSYRFLANSSNIETIENSRIYIKYPEWVSQDGTAVFGYYILEYGADGINVYYGKSIAEEPQFLYLATRTEKITDYETPGIKESDAQTGENTASEMTAEELLDLFISGSISAISSADSASAFYITDLDMDSGEWDSYSIGERVDLDNDGENELILCGPYGGRYLDARDNRVYEFAAGEGTGYMLSYVVYHGATWIMYSSRMHAGYELFYMEKFEGADNLAAEMNFGQELVDANNIESGMRYTLNGTEISHDEYFELCSKIFATEIYTNE